MTKSSLWNALVAFQKYPFHTATGPPFVYEEETDAEADELIEKTTEAVGADEVSEPLEEKPIPKKRGGRKIFEKNKCLVTT